MVALAQACLGAVKNQEHEPHIARFYREQAERAAAGLPEPEPDTEMVDEYERELARLKALEPPCPECGLPSGVAKSYCGDGRTRHPGCVK